jgi:hypothetical protein
MLKATSNPSGDPMQSIVMLDIRNQDLGHLKSSPVEVLGE